MMYGWLEESDDTNVILFHCFTTHHEFQVPKMEES